MRLKSKMGKSGTAKGSQDKDVASAKQQKLPMATACSGGQEKPQDVDDFYVYLYDEEDSSTQNQLNFGGKN